MNPRTLLIAVLATSLLLVGGAGAVAAGDAPDTGQDVSPDSDDALSSSQSAYADGDAVGVDSERELPETLPEAVGHALILLGQLLEVVPSALGETVIGLL